MKKTMGMAFAIFAVIPVLAFGQISLPTGQKPAAYIRVENPDGTVTDLPTSITVKPGSLTQVDSKNGVPVYAPAPLKAESAENPERIPESPVIPRQDAPIRAGNTNGNGTGTAAGTPSWRLPNIENQEQLNGLRNVLGALQDGKIDMGKAAGLITVVPGPRVFNVTIFGIGKNNGLKVPTTFRMFNIPRPSGTPPDRDFFNFFTLIPGNESVATPPADTGGLGTPPGAPQPAEYSIPPVPIPVKQWGLPNPQTIIPKVTPDGFALVLNFNPYQVVSSGLGGMVRIKYRLGVRGSEMVVVFSDPDKDGKYEAHFYTLDPSKPNGVGIVFKDGGEFLAYAIRQGYLRPTTTFFGNPTYIINADGAWRYPGLKFHAAVDTYVPIRDKDGNIISFSMRDKEGHDIMPLGPVGTDTIKKNPNAQFWIYYNPKNGKYELKPVDNTLPSP